MPMFHPTIGGLTCLDPGELYPQSIRQDLPLDFWKRANSYRCPRGVEPGEAWLLMLRSQINSLNKNSYVPLVMRSGDDVVTFLKVLFHKATCMTPSGKQDDENAAYLVHFYDKRHLLRMHVEESTQYNVRRAAWPGTAADNYLLRYYETSLNGDEEPFSWQEVIDDLWGGLPASLAGSSPTIPASYTPDGLPSGLQFFGVSTWNAIHIVLAKIGCTTAYDPMADTFSIVKLGGDQDGLSEALELLKSREIFSYSPIEALASRFPEKIRVLFHRFDDDLFSIVDAAGNGTHQDHPVYSKDVATSIGGAVAGTTLAVWDDMPAIYNAAGSLTNGSALDARASQVASNVVGNILLSEGRLLRRYTGLVTTVGIGSRISSITWSDYGDGVKTEIVRAPSVAIGRGDAAWVSVAGAHGAAGLGERLMPPDLGRATLPRNETCAWATLTTDLEGGEDATAQLQEQDSDGTLGSLGSVITCFAPTLEEDYKIPSGAIVKVERDRRSGCWNVITASECAVRVEES